MSFAYYKRQVLQIWSTPFFSLHQISFSVTVHTHQYSAHSERTTYRSYLEQSRRFLHLGSLSFSLISLFSFKVCVFFLFFNYSLILFWIFWRLMEDDVSNPFRRMSMRTRKIAPKMAAALASNDNRTQVSVFLLKRLRKKNVLQLFD